MHKLIFTITVCLSFVCAAAASAQPPMVTFPTPSGAGAFFPFNSTDNVNELPVDYGSIKSTFGWNFDTWQGRALSGNNALHRFIPTLQGPGALTPMGEMDDWVFHMEFQYPGPYGTADYFVNAKAEPGYAGTDPGNPREQRIFALNYDATGNWSVAVGNNDGSGYVDAFTGLLADEYIDFDVHYRANASTMDFYWDGTLLGSAPTGHGRYDIDLVQFEEIVGSGTTSVRNIRLGHVTTTGGPSSNIREWSMDTSGNWTNGSFWSGGGAPTDKNDVTARFGTAITQPRTVFTDAAVSVHAVQFDSANMYAVAGTGNVNLIANSSAPLDHSLLEILDGTHQFQAMVNLHNETDAIIASESTLHFNNVLNLMGNTLTKSGGGTLSLNNALHTGGGTINVQQGTIAGFGTVGGDVVNDGGTISPGSHTATTSSVPEPGTLGIVLIGLVCLAAGCYHRKHGG